MASKQQRGDYVFTVKEYASGGTWLAMEPMHKSPEHLDGWGIGFELRGSPSVAEAQQVADYLNDRLGDLVLF